MHVINTDVFQIYQNLIDLERVQSGYLQQICYLDFLSFMVNNQKVKYPIRHKLCQKINEQQHICGCLKQISFAEEEVYCNQLSLMNHEDLLVAHDHYHIIQAIHRTTNGVTIFSGDPFVKFFMPNINMLNDKKILELYQKLKLNQIKDQNFSVKIKSNPYYNKYTQIIYSIQSQTDERKISIPIRFNQCKHVDCLDFFSLMMKLQKQQNEGLDNKIYCGIIQSNMVCQFWSYIDYSSLGDNLVMDIELMEIIKSLNQLNSSFIYNLQTYQVQESFYQMQHPNNYKIQQIFENSLIQGLEQNGFLNCTLNQLNVDLKVNGLRANYPINHSDCPYRNAISHICGCLEQILNANHDVKCGILSLMDIKKLISLPDHQQIIRNTNQSAFSISLYFGLICHKITREQKLISLLYEKEYQDLFVKIKQKSTHEYFFSNRIRNSQNFNTQEVIVFNSICFMDFVKLSIPMRFKRCLHLECFDLVSLLKRIKQNTSQNMKTIKCAIEKNGIFCKSECLIDQNYLSEELIIDIELLQIIRNQDQFSYKFLFDAKKYQVVFLPQEVNTRNSQIIRNNQFCYKYQTKLHAQLQLDDSFQDVYSIINLQKTDQFYKKFNIYQDFKISKYCPLAQAQGIKYIIQQPGRCNNCKQQQCGDLKYLVQEFFYQKKNNPNSKYICPLCGQESSKRICDIIPNQIFYHDVNIFKQILRNQSQNDQNDQNDFITVKGSDNLLNKFMSEYSLEESSPSEFIIYTQLMCIKSNQRLKYPLLILKCPQKSRINFDFFFEEFSNQSYLLNEEKFMIFCGCEYCSTNKIVSLQQLGFDSIMFQMLQLLPENYNNLKQFYKFQLQNRQNIN